MLYLGSKCKIIYKEWHAYGGMAMGMAVFENFLVSLYKRFYFNRVRYAKGLTRIPS